MYALIFFSEHAQPKQQTNPRGELEGLLQGGLALGEGLGRLEVEVEVGLFVGGAVLEHEAGGACGHLTGKDETRLAREVFHILAGIGHVLKTNTSNILSGHIENVTISSFI
jgi:hypothetical protein